MAKDKFFKQCLLARDTERTVGWIPVRAAVKGLWVELIEFPGKPWQVLESYNFIAEAQEVSQMQERARKSFASVGGR